MSNPRHLVVSLAALSVLALGCGPDHGQAPQGTTGKADDFGGCVEQRWPAAVPRLDVQRLTEDGDFRPQVLTTAEIPDEWWWNRQCITETPAAWDIEITEDLPLYATLISKAHLVLQIYTQNPQGEWVLTPKSRLERIKAKSAADVRADTREEGTLKVLLPPGRYRLAVGWDLGSTWWRAPGTYCTEGACEGPGVASSFGFEKIWPAELLLRRGKRCPQVQLPDRFVIKEQRTWYADREGNGEHYGGRYGLPRFNVWGEDGSDFGEMFYDVDESQQWSFFREVNQRTIRWADGAGNTLVETFENVLDKKVDVRNCDGMLIGMLSLVSDDGGGNTFYRITNSLGQTIGRSFRESPNPNIPINPAYWEPTRFVVKAPDSDEVIAETSGGRVAYADLWRVSLQRQGLDARLFLSSAVSQTTNDSQDQKACYDGNGNTTHYYVSLYGDLPPADDEKCRFCCAKEGSQTHAFDVRVTVNDYCCGGYDEDGFCQMWCDDDRTVRWRCKCK